MTADYYLSAVTQDVLPELLPAEVLEREPVFANLRNLRASPITGVHLWFDRTVMSEPFLTLLDSTTQWVFNKTQLFGGPANGACSISNLVISASYSLTPRSRQESIDLCLTELREVLPSDNREATLVKGTVVVKEMCATFSPAPWILGPVAAPAQKKSAGAGLHFTEKLGDWTATGWPSTMEGAVRSGYLAAECDCFLMPARHENFCDPICVRKGWPGCGPVNPEASAASSRWGATCVEYSGFLPNIHVAHSDSGYDEVSPWRFYWSGSISNGAI